MDSDENKTTTNVIMFAPNTWGEVLKFKHFAHPTYNFYPYGFSELVGVDGHFEKYTVLIGIAKRLVPRLAEDEEQLTKNGYSTAIHAKELTVIIEAIFCEFYSVLDCTRQVIHTIYGKYRGANVKKTSRLFKNAADEKIDERVPVEIRKALAESYGDWFPRLRDIRTAIVHSGIGFCSESKDGKISYFHDELGRKNGNVLAVNDIFEDISIYAEKVNMFIGCVFHTLNQTLDDVDTIQTCGIFGSFIYQRSVSPYEARDFHSGKCKSYESFEKGAMPRCPFAGTCGAYKRVLEQRNSSNEK
ncbi:hypothetical protein [Methanohalophilus halophilus]|uniref:Uncharacterized protein n=1 Tax=Methanohalophilus halophilus TaxID=2177 RepID=A0A1L3Q3Q8_9EURY|nr:hypothetical protein [Methanohalophilus halophilus]APH39480.1 hypothetical protein BHR79_08305 [Methanohalophilus halophilus]RNI07262.1 hypothetical protein EFE40_10340 [Methanohalophilus halophilus]SDW27511.1 hypothetical protein SAMN04515625_0569 [Methanohalophilus halophilus]